MKIVFFGGGSHRYLSIARSIMAVPGLMDEGEINLYDLAVERSEAVGRMAMKSPEFKDANCSITWGTSLDEALEGANVVFVVLMAGSRRNFAQLASTCTKHGFIGSDQLSPSGAMLALKGGPILMDLAKRMERLCPNAWLADFANPVAVLGAAVNNHTKVNCLGVCAGYTNHQWDLTRLLFDKDEQWTDYKINCAGVNHMSFILPGSTWQGRDLYQMAEEKITIDLPVPTLSDRWNDMSKANITNSVKRMNYLYRKYKSLIFSSEGDGLAHLDMEGDYYAAVERQTPPPTNEELAKRDKDGYEKRQEADRNFKAWLDVELDATAWNTERKDALYLLRADEDVMVKIAKALGGIEELDIATSYLNNGAVEGFTDRTVLEYSQILSSEGLRPAGKFKVPDLFYGLTSALASHQTLLGDAIATLDPRLLFEALYSYPVQQDTKESKALWRDLLEVAAEEIPTEFQETRELFQVPR